MLLTLIFGRRGRCAAEVSTIWTIGQQVANNTIHIALLDTTNHIAGEDPRSAEGIVAATAAMRRPCRALPRVPGLRARHGAER